jgi:hypothetical protein
MYIYNIIMWYESIRIQYAVSLHGIVNSFIFSADWNKHFLLFTALLW